MPSPLVRVTDPVSRVRVTVSAARAKKLGLDPLKQPATDRFGVPLPAKPREDKLRTPVQESEDAKPSDTKKEND